MLFFFMGSGISYVWSNFEKTQIGYDLSQLKKEEMASRDKSETEIGISPLKIASKFGVQSR